MPEKIVVHIDGASRGNPGPAASGFIIKDSSGNQLQAKAIFLGKTTNNVAEYNALTNALIAAKEITNQQITIYSDSELLVRQINGQYKVKSEQIKPLFQQANALLENFHNWKVIHVMREKNKAADKLANQALDLGHDVESQPKPADQNQKPIQLGVLISGGGTTLTNILEYINAGRLNAKVSIVISSRSTVKGVERAKNAGLEVEVIRKIDYPDIDEFSKRIEETLTAANVDLVIQGGWLCLWKIPSKYDNRVMNIHPALLPCFGGKGMWGHHVHEAVLKAGCKVSGCTVHFCTNEYDDGPIIIQRTCPAYDNDTPDTLAARVFEQECIAYPEAIRLFAEDKLTVQNGIVKIKT